MGSISARVEITVKYAREYAKVEDEPGSFEGDTVAHRGPTLKGEFCRTLNLTDMRTGWVFTRSIRNNASIHILAGLAAAVEQVPFLITGLDFDNGSEFINHDVVNWAAGRDIVFTRSRPYKKNDQATIESKNNHLVRHYSFYWRYDPPPPRDPDPAEPALAARERPDELPHPDEEADRLRHRPARPPAPALRQARDPDGPTPESRSPLPAQETELIAYRDGLNPAQIAREIQRIQDQLTGLARRPTLDLEARAATPLPDTSKGVKLRPAS